MKAPNTYESAIERTISLIALIAVMVFWVVPFNIVAAANPQTPSNSALIFELNSKAKTELVIKENQKYLTMEELQNSDPKFQFQNLLQQYLLSKRSPMAQCAEVLAGLKNVDKIISLSNAESSYGLRLTPNTYNAWGVMAGGHLKKMGNNWCEAVVNMDKFLSEYPRRGKTYSQMTITEMCGIYKQPCPGKANHHWARNNVKVLSDITNLREQAHNQALSFNQRFIAASNEVAFK